MAQIMKARGLNANFVQVPNEILQRKDLSLSAKGLICYLLSLPDDWVICKTKLHLQLKEGRDAVMNAFDELVKHGYVVQVKNVGVSGRFDYDYIVYNQPILPENDRYGFSVNGAAVTDNPLTVNPLPLKEDSNKQIEQREKKKAHSPENFKKVAPNYTNNLTYGAYERLWDVPIPQAFKEKLNGRTDAEKILGAISEKWDTFCRVRYTAHNKRFHTDISEAQALSDFLRQCKSLDHAMQSLDAMIGKEAINPFVVEYKQQTVTAQSKRLVL